MVVLQQLTSVFQVMVYASAVHVSVIETLTDLPVSVRSVKNLVALLTV